MRITREAIEQGIFYTHEAEENLLNNLNVMRNITDSALSEWNDANVQRFYDIYEKFDNYVKSTNNNLEEIEECLRNFLRFMDDYNS